MGHRRGRRRWVELRSSRQQLLGGILDLDPVVAISWTLAPPQVLIKSPANGAVYAQGQTVASAFACGEGAGGTGISTCVDQSGKPSGTAIDTSTQGAHTFTVIAGSTDGLAGTATVSYTVEAPITTPALSTHSSADGYTFTLASPGGCIAPGGKLTSMAATSGSGKNYRIVSYSYFIDHGIAHRKRVTVDGKHRLITVHLANRVSSHAGLESLPLSGLKPGRHTLAVVILLRPTAKPRHGHKPRTRSIRLSLDFTIC